MPVSTHVLRGSESVPYAFGELGGDGAEAPALPTFAPLSGFPVIGEEPAEEPAPAPPVKTFEEGQAAGRAERDDEVAELRAEVERLSAALDDAERGADDQARTVEETAERLSAGWAEAVRQTEPALAALAIETAEAVLDAPLSSEQRAATEAALSGAIGTLAAQAPTTVALPPVDLLQIQESGLAAALDQAHGGLRWESRSDLNEGDWTVTTSEAAVRRVRAEMIAALRERLGLDPA